MEQPRMEVGRKVSDTSSNKVAFDAKARAHIDPLDAPSHVRLELDHNQNRERRPAWCLLFTI